MSFILEKKEENDGEEIPKKRKAKGGKMSKPRIILLIVGGVIFLVGLFLSQIHPGWSALGIGIGGVLLIVGLFFWNWIAGGPPE